MAVLRTLFAGAMVAGCYSPSLPDCVVACASDGDCAPEQICGDDSLCAVPEHAGSCAPAPSDAGAPDAARCTVVVEIEGKGGVVIDGLVECTHKAPDHSCTFDLPAVPHEVIAVPEPGELFARWTSVVCLGQDDSCYLAYCTATTTIGVKFMRED